MNSEFRLGRGCAGVLPGLRRRRLEEEGEEEGEREREEGRRSQGAMRR